MLELTDPEMITLGIGGAALMGLCVVETPVLISVRLVCFVIGVIMLAIALLDMVTN